jgi:hypothetical protein
MARDIENKFLTPEKVDVTPEAAAPVVELVKSEVIPEIKTEPVKTEVIPEVKTEIPDHYKKLEELSGGKYKFTNDDEVKSFFDTHDKIKTEAESRKDLDDYYTGLEQEIISNKDYDPIAKFGGEENYKKTIVAQELGRNGDPTIATKFVFGDRSKMDAIETLSLFAQYQDSSLVGDSDTATRTALRQLGIPIDRNTDLKEALDSLEKEDKSIINIRAKEIKGIVDKAIAGVPIPEISNPLKQLFDKTEQRKTKAAELKGRWDETITSLQSSLDKITFKDADFEFEIPEADKAILNEFIRVASLQGREPNDAQKAEVIQRVKDAIYDKRRSEIMQAFRAKIETDVKKQKDAEHHNLSPLTTDKVVIEDAKSKEAESSLRKQMGLKT